MEVFFLFSRMQSWFTTEQMQRICKLYPTESLGVIERFFSSRRQSWSSKEKIYCAFLPYRVSWPSTAVDVSFSVHSFEPSLLNGVHHDPLEMRAQTWRRKMFYPCRRLSFLREQSVCVRWNKGRPPRHNVGVSMPFNHCDD